MRWKHQEDVAGCYLPAVFRVVAQKEEKLVLWEDQGKATVSPGPRGQPGQVKNVSSLRDRLAVALQSNHLIRRGIRIAAHQQASLQGQHNILLLPLLKHKAPCSINRKNKYLIWDCLGGRAGGEDWCIFDLFLDLFTVLPLSCASNLLMHAQKSCLFWTRTQRPWIKQILTVTVYQQHSVVKLLLKDVL